jgi:hypothetical protein
LLSIKHIQYIQVFHKVDSFRYKIYNINNFYKCVKNIEKTMLINKIDTMYKQTNEDNKII